MNSKSVQYKKNTVVVDFSDGDAMSRTEVLEEAAGVHYNVTAGGFVGRTVRGATTRIVNAVSHPAMTMPQKRGLRR